MPENEESRRLQLTPQREEPAETPEERTKRFQLRAPEGETPEQRTNRFLEKARRAGYMHQSPMTPGGALVNDASGPTDFEVDEQGNIVPPAPEPITWQNAGTELPNRMGDALSKLVGADKVTPDQRLENELKLTVFRNKARMAAAQALHAAKNMETGPVPGSNLWNNPAFNATEKAYKDHEAARNQPDRAPREPVQMQREFSNDTEKEAYLDRVRQAMKNAAAK